LGLCRPRHVSNKNDGRRTLELEDFFEPGSQQTWVISGHSNLPFLHTSDFVILKSHFRNNMLLVVARNDQSMMEGGIFCRGLAIYTHSEYHGSNTYACSILNVPINMIDVQVHFFLLWGFKHKTPVYKVLYPISMASGLSRFNSESHFDRKWKITVAHVYSDWQKLPHFVVVKEFQTIFFQNHELEAYFGSVIY